MIFHEAKTTTNPEFRSSRQLYERSRGCYGARIQRRRTPPTVPRSRVFHRQLNAGAVCSNARLARVEEKPNLTTGATRKSYVH